MIDDMGRIPIPKEIRRQIKIREFYRFEIFTEGENRIVLQKVGVPYSVDSLNKQRI